MSSTVLVQMKWTQRSFHASMKVRMASVTRRTEVDEARRMACRVMMENNDSTRFVHDEWVGVKCRWLPLGDEFEELQELDATVPWVARIGHSAGGDLQRGEHGDAAGGALWAVIAFEQPSTTGTRARPRWDGLNSRPSCNSRGSATPLAGGVPVEVISKRLGHSRISTTMDLYVHPSDVQQRAAADAFGALVAGGVGA